MFPRKMFQVSTFGGLGLAALLTITGCETKGPAEKAGQQVDQGIQDVKDAVNPPGPGEKAGRALDKVGKP